MSKPDITVESILEDFNFAQQEQWELDGFFRSPGGRQNGRTRAAAGSYLERATAAHWGPLQYLKGLKDNWPASVAGMTGVTYGNHPDGHRYIEVTNNLSRPVRRFYLRKRTAIAHTGFIDP
jgi:hypothetical protein